MNPICEIPAIVKNGVAYVCVGGKLKRLAPLDDVGGVEDIRRLECPWRKWASKWSMESSRKKGDSRDSLPGWDGWAYRRTVALRQRAKEKNGNFHKGYRGAHTWEESARRSLAYITSRFKKHECKWRLWGESKCSSQKRRIARIND